MQAMKPTVYNKGNPIIDNLLMAWDGNRKMLSLMISPLESVARDLDAVQNFNLMS